MTEKVRLVCISDTHNKAHHIPDLPSGDILIHAGDATNMGRDYELTDFFEWLQTQRRRYSAIVWVPGNHDGLQMEKDPTFVLARKVPFTGHMLVNDSVDIGGLKIHGFSYTPVFGDWSYMAAPARMEERAKTIDRSAHVLVSHGPAFGIRDKNRDGERCGCKTLYRVTTEMPNLKAHVFGHIHEGHGQMSINGSVRANVSICDARYNPVNPPTVIDISI
jgi:Icc-related predicted phosphoesterase